MVDRSDSAAQKYHNDTKHSFQSVRSDFHYLDFSNKPMPFKVYEEIEPIALPPEPPRAMKNALKSISSLGEEAGEKKTAIVGDSCEDFFSYCRDYQVRRSRWSVALFSCRRLYRGTLSY